MNVQQQQQHLINGSTNPTLQHYLVNNHIVNGSTDHSMKNVQVQILKQEQSGQRFILNRQYVQNTQIQEQPQIVYWAIVEIESNNEINSYVLVESKDVIGCPKLETLTTGKLVIVNVSGKQRRATIVMASSELIDDFSKKKSFG